MWNLLQNSFKKDISLGELKNVKSWNGPIVSAQYAIFIPEMSISPEKIEQRITSDLFC